MKKQAIDNCTLSLPIPKDQKQQIVGTHEKPDKHVDDHSHCEMHDISKKTRIFFE